MAAASISIKGTKTGVSADGSGHFTITAPSNATLVISAVNYQLQEVAVDGRTTIDVTLSILAKLGDEVIVVGYGTQKKEAVTGSVASMSGEKLNMVPAVDISRALQGRIPGVQMSQTSSKPGTGMQIRIRGTRSLNASNDPLIVMDGIPFGGYLNDISPSEIKSIDILKDASATAIYGSRGANGVI